MCPDSRVAWCTNEYDSSLERFRGCRLADIAAAKEFRIVLGRRRSDTYDEIAASAYFGERGVEDATVLNPDQARYLRAIDRGSTVR